jgi:hypothetical protein
MEYLSLLVPLLTLAVLPLADRLERWALSSDPVAAEPSSDPAAAEPVTVPPAPPAVRTGSP